MENEETDRYLYHADGSPYWDGDEDDADIVELDLFLANGKPANLSDFTDRYIIPPPENWAKRFKDYEKYKPGVVIWTSTSQKRAEELIGTATSQIIELKDFVDPKLSNILNEISVIYTGEREILNGEAGIDKNNKRYIKIFADTELVLINLNTFIFSNFENNLDVSTGLLNLAKFIGSRGNNGSAIGALKATLPYSIDHAENAIILANAIPYAECMHAWIIAHECAHHMQNHIEKIKKYIVDNNHIIDENYYRLSRQLELEADLEATKLIKTMSDQKYLRFPLETNLTAIDNLLSFTSFCDDIMGIDYDNNSSHPAPKVRLDAFRDYVKSAGFEIEDFAYEWQNNLRSIKRRS